MGLKRRRTPPKRVLNMLLKYEPETGDLFWRPREIDPARDIAKQKSWNTRYAGKRAGTDHKEGYRSIQLKSIGYSGLAHRIIWKMQFGTEPQEIDHINGNRSDNRLKNLRSTSRKQNTKNRRLNDKSASVYHGVRWNPSRKKWIASIGRGGR